MSSQHLSTVKYSGLRRGLALAFCGILGITACVGSSAADWPTYRHDIRRSATTSETIGPELHLNWQYLPAHAPKPAWPLPAEELPRMHVDNAYHAVASEGNVFIGTSVTDEILSIDAATGVVRWTFTAEGPVRYAPAVAASRVYFGSDDGYVYCLDAATGALLWRFRAGPSDEKVIGNGRMISLWPVRTSVLVDGGVAYFGAGIFPYEGVYVCALDARDGAVLWKNDTTGDRSHELEYGGISPQGYPVASDDVLYVPSGRAMPAAFDRQTGKFLFYASPGGKTGGVWALLDRERLVAGIDMSGTPRKAAYDAATGGAQGDVFGWFPGIDMVLNEAMSYVVTPEGAFCLSRERHAAVRKPAVAIADRQKELRRKLSALRRELLQADEPTKERVSSEIDEVVAEIYELGQQDEELKESTVLWQFPCTGLASVVLAGDLLFAGGEDLVIGLDAGSGEERWRTAVLGRAVGLAPVDGRLFVSTDMGAVYSFGPGQVERPKAIKAAHDPWPYSGSHHAALYASAAEQIVAETDIEKGYCLVVDCGAGHLAHELAKRTELQIVGIEHDPAALEIARRNLANAGMLGHRVVVEPWDLAGLPDSFANLIVSDGMLTSGKTSALEKELQRLLRPYGGVLCLGVAEGDAIAWSRSVRGPLEGAGSWTQQFGNPQNTACSEDDLVKGPLGIQWFGEPGPRHMVERHAKAASPVSMNGILYVQGEEVIMAYDAFNGTYLWEREIPGAVRVRADADGGNLALGEEGLYVAAHDTCYRLDPKTGDIVRTYSPPPRADGAQRRWGVIARLDGMLLGTRAMPLKNDYAAILKELTRIGSLPDPEAMSQESREMLGKDPSFWAYYEDLRDAYGAPGVDLQRDFQRAGTNWRGITNFPAWENYESANASVSDRMMISDMVFAMDPDSGALLWAHEGDRIAHIAVTAGDGRVFLADCAVSDEQRRQAIEERRVLTESGIYKEAQDEAARVPGVDVRNVVCLDSATGETIWEKPVDFTGCCGDAMGAAYRDGVLLFFGNVGNHDAWRFRDAEMRYKRIAALSAGTGDVLWSRPLNYRTRPVVVGNRIIIEPRACDLRTGAIETREHPVSGQEVPWEWLRPGHTCALSSASAHALFYRSAFTAFYDLDDDRGVISFGGIRPGCLINLIPAGGLLLFPEASSGCTCSYPVRCSVALRHKPQRIQPWTVFVTHGRMTPAKHFAINLGAPADMKDDAGTVWFAYPNPSTGRYNHFPHYGVKFDLRAQVHPEMGYFCHDFREAVVPGTDRPWLFASGCLGPFRCRVPLIDPALNQGPGRYLVRLGFMAPEGDSPGARVFDVKLAGRTVLEDFDIAGAAGGAGRAVVKEFPGVSVSRDLAIELLPNTPDTDLANAPVLNFIEAIREDPVPVEESAWASLSDADAEALLAAVPAAPPAEALETYHRVLNESRSVALQRRALDGMAEIGSTESLRHIARFAKDAPTILWDYELPPKELNDAALRVQVAVAGNLTATNREDGLHMLRHALTLADWDTRVRIWDVLDQIGAPVGTAAAKNGFITDWHIAGPFPWDDGAQFPFDATFVDEPSPDLTLTYPGLGGAEVRWRRFCSEEPIVDLVPLLGRDEWCAAYAYAEFALPSDRDMLLKIGSNDGFKCWLNGVEVGRFNGGRGCEPDRDVLKVTGRQGTNAVLLKITQMGAGWGFCARLSDLDNNPIPYRR